MELKGKKPKDNSLLLPYQRKWVLDKSRMKLAEKSRQIGWSWATAYGIVARKAKGGERLDAWVSSRDDIQAKLFLEDCKHFGAILHTAATELGQMVISEELSNAYTLRLANGLRIHSMSSNADAQAGKRGDRILDEFALHPDPRKLYGVAYPGITWGGVLEIFSTHRGSHNYFNELVKEVREKGNPKGFSLHRTTLENALDQGLLYKLQAKLPPGDERLDMDEQQYFDHIKARAPDDESFAQEYMCTAADDEAAFLDYSHITDAEYRVTDGKWEIDLERCVNPCYMGVDIGRDVDITVIIVLEKVADVYYTRRRIELSKKTYEEQEAVVYDLLKYHAIKKCSIDKSGIGRQFFERAEKKFGSYRIEGVQFTGPTKEDLAFPLKSAFEERRIRIPFDPRLRSDLRGIRKETTRAGNVRFAGERTSGRHNDNFWAIALALYAGKQGQTGFITTTDGIRMGRQSRLTPTFRPRILRISDSGTIFSSFSNK